MLRVRAFWGKSYSVQVYRTTDVAELALSVIFHCVSDSCPDDFVDQQFMHSKEFAVKVGALRHLNDVFTCSLTTSHFSLDSLQVR